MSAHLQISKIFNHGDGYQVRTVPINGETWFVAKDVCNALGLKNTSQSVRKLTNSEKGIYDVYTLGGTQRLLCISESGLYGVTFTSTKTEAQLFRQWVTSEVLPEIRKTGGFTSRTMTSAELIFKQAGELVRHERKLAEHDAKIDNHEGRIQKLELVQPGQGYITVRGYASKHRIQIDIKQAKAIGIRAGKCAKREGVNRKKVEDAKWGSLWSYPESFLATMFEC